MDRGADWCVVIPFAHVDHTQNPNIPKNQLDSQSEIYFRSMAAAFASARRWSPDVRLVLLTDGDPHPVSNDLFAAAGVEVRRRPFKHMPPAGFLPYFAGSLYMLDALAEFDGQSTLYLDPDILCVAPLDPLFELGARGVAALPIEYPPTYPVNGLSRTGAGALHELLGQPGPAAPVHYGGECYVVPQAASREVHDRTEAAWQWSQQRWQAGETHFFTEEHLLSYTLAGMDTQSLSPYAKRIWTTSRFRNVEGDEDSLLLWHLPAEKGKAMDAIFAVASDAGSWFWTADSAEFKHRVGHLANFHGRTFSKWSRDLLGTTARKLRPLEIDRHARQSGTRAFTA